MKRARATIDARKGRVNCGFMSPRSRQFVIGREQFEADGVFQHMRRRIGFGVQRAPHRDARGGAVGARRVEGRRVSRTLHRGHGGKVDVVIQVQRFIESMRL